MTTALEKKKKREYQRTWRKTHPDKAAAIKTKYENKHGRWRLALLRSKRHARIGGYAACVSSEEELAAAFTGKCNNPMCQVEETDTIRLFMDHDHVTGAFRGWLCLRCNMALGYVKDSENTLLGLLAYIRGIT